MPALLLEESPAGAIEPVLQWLPDLRIERTEPSPAELADGDALSMHRIRFRFINNEYARLHAMIRAINAF